MMPGTWGQWVCLCRNSTEPYWWIQDSAVCLGCGWELGDMGYCDRCDEDTDEADA